MATSPLVTDVDPTPNWDQALLALDTQGSVLCENNANLAREMRAEFEERLVLRAGATQIRFVRPDESITDPANYVLATFTGDYRYVLVIDRHMIKEDSTSPALRSIVLRPLLRQLIAETTPEEEELPDLPEEVVSDEVSTPEVTPAEAVPNADGWLPAPSVLI